MTDLVGTPEGNLLHDIGSHQLRVDLAADEVASAERYLAGLTDVRNRMIGDASIQLLLMRNAPNISEAQKLAFATQILRLNGADSLDDQAIMEQFDRFVPGAPIVSVSEHPFFARVIMSESGVGIRPNYNDKPGFTVSIDCRTRSVNHHRDKDHPDEFVEFGSGIGIPLLKDVVVGLPALQEYIDTFSNSIPTDKKERVAYQERLAHVFSSIEDMDKLGVEGASQLKTTRLTTLQSLATRYGSSYEDGSWYSGRSGYGWWPRH